MILRYEDDPRDLWDFPEVCAWIQALDRSFPYWFYFMDIGPNSTLKSIAYSVCKHDKSPGGIFIPSDEWTSFLHGHVAAMNALAQQLGDDLAENERRSLEVVRYLAAGDRQ